MANVKITDLSSLTGANAASNDVVPVVDVSSDITVKMSRGEFFKSVPAMTTIGNVGIGTTLNSWGTGWLALQVGTGVSLWGGYNSATYLSNNEYYNGSNRIRIFADLATEYAQLSGQHIWYNAPTGVAGSTITFTQAMTLDSVGALILNGSTAQKATGTTWSNPSDQRLKTNIMDYPKGILELMQVRVCEWEYNGKGGTTDGLKGLGVIADEIMTVLPNTVATYNAKLNAEDEDTTEIKKFDATEITWLLVKAVQEQQVMIENLQAEITALKV